MVPGDTLVLLPIQNGLVADCRQQDVMFVRVQVSVDYSYCICGMQPLRLDFYIDCHRHLRRWSTGRIKRTTSAGTADICTLDTQQAAGAILHQTYPAAPGQLTAAAFMTTSAILSTKTGRWQKLNPRFYMSLCQQSPKPSSWWLRQITLINPR